MATPSHVPEELRSHILIPSAAQPNAFYLGPMGDTDPVEFINLETMRIPFKTSNMDLSHWNHSFRTWPSKTTGWRNWWRRVSNSNHAFWEQLGIDQCITLSLSEMEKNEPMLIAACHFWSDTINAFMFAGGPMTPTLADILKITGLNISGAYSPFDLSDGKASHRFNTKNIGGWAGYITQNSKTGSVDHREHTAFLNMWLEKFVFCGTTIGPTTNHQLLAEALADGKDIPIGKFLLGSAYSLLHQVRVKLSADKAIGTIGGPWWLIQMWLNLYLHKAMAVDLNKLRFPSDYAEDEDETLRRCMSYGELAAAIPGCAPEPISVTRFFNCFYYGCSKEETVRFLYTDEDDYELPLFRFSEALAEYKENFHTMLTPALLPVGFHQGRSRLQSYEFYNPSAASRQLGCGQLPIGLHFTDKLKPRERVNSRLQFNRLENLTATFPSFTIGEWHYGPFTSKLFREWWIEWKKHLFCTSSRIFCERFCADYVVSDDDEEDINVEPPTKSPTGRTVKYAPPSTNPYIGAKAPSVTDIAAGKTLEAADTQKRKQQASASKRTKVPAKKKAKQVAPSSQSSKEEEAPRREGRRKKIHDPLLKKNCEQSSTGASSKADAPGTQTTGQSIGPETSQRSRLEDDTFGHNNEQEIIPSPTSSHHSSRSSDTQTSAARPTRRTLEEEITLNKALDTPADSIFPFNADEFLPENEVSSRPSASSSSAQNISDDVKIKLEQILVQLNKDTTTLVQNADPIRRLYSEMKNLLAPEITSALAPVAFLEAYEIQVMQAQKRLADRSAQQAAKSQKDASRREAVTLKEKLDAYAQIPTKIDEEIHRLHTKETQLIKELEEVRSALKDQEQKLQQLPTEITKTKEELAQKIRETRLLAKRIEPIPGTAEEDAKIINDVDQIRQRAIEVVRRALGLL